MSDDIPPLIPNTPPPMTKLDWDDDEDFLDYPHSTLEMPSESSLSPESGWNPIDELPLPFDVDDVEKLPADCLESSCNGNTSNNIITDGQNPESLLSEPNSSLHHNDLSVWKDKENILTSENIENETFNQSFDNGNETDIKPHHGASENSIDCSRKCIDDSSVKILNNIEQHACEIEKSNVTSQYLPDLECNSEAVKHSPVKSSHKVDDFNQIDVEKLSHQSINVQNVLFENSKNLVSSTDSNMNLSNVYLKEPSVKNNSNNNNMIVVNGEEDDFSGFCDFESALPNIPNLLSPVKAHCLHNEMSSKSVEQYTSAKISDTSQEQNFNSIYNLDGSTIQNQPDNSSNIEHHLDPEFDDFSDFHGIPADENKLSCVSDICDMKNDADKLTAANFKHSNVEQIKYNTSTNNTSTFETDNQNNIDDDDYDNFCEFESGYTAYDHHGQPTPNSKQNDTIIDSKSLIQIDYKKFCVEAFQGDHDFCPEIDLQNLDEELNNTQVWHSLKDIESSPALSYNWSKSEANNVFLSSLSIDSRNILYGASWNLKVPRFAANMSNSPLEPLKASINITTVTKMSQCFPIDDSLQDTVPDPEFDWKTSGLINPLDCNHTSLLEIDLLPCCTNTLQPQTWKTSEVLKDEESFVEHSADLCDKIFDAPLQTSDNQSTEIMEHPNTSISFEAHQILDALPNFEVLQKPYLVILENEGNNLFLN